MKLQSEVLQYLKGLGKRCWVIKVIEANERGCPDILCCYGGLFLAFEIKEAGDVLSETQKVQINRINEADGEAQEVRSLEELKVIIAAADMALCYMNKLFNHS